MQIKRALADTTGMMMVPTLDPGIVVVGGSGGLLLTDEICPPPTAH